MATLEENLVTLDRLSHDDVLEALKYDKIPDFDTFLEVTQHTGNPRRAGTNNLYGFNHRNIKTAVPENREVYGLTFFTRPQLNLSTPNIKRNRKFYPLLSNNEFSIQRYVRCMLDPRLNSLGINNDYWLTKSNIENMFKDAEEVDDIKRVADYLHRQKMELVEGCPLVDPNMGFIPVLSNNLLSLSGWPDIAISSYTSDQGHKREQWIMVDSAYEFLEAFNLTAVFRNTRDEPILLMFQMWELYMAQVFEGMIMPYMDMVANNEMDYNTRIYRLVLDESKRYVKKIAACGAAFPVNVPTGKFFDYTDEDTYNKSVKEIDITFQCVGADYNDYITINEFNWVSGMFNGYMRRVLNGDGPEDHNMVKIPRGLLHLLNNRGYPLINPRTLELQWWISRDSKDLTKLIDLIDFTKIPATVKQNATIYT